MATRDCAHLPLWKESVDLAHAVLASLEESGARSTVAGRDACRAAVAIPSLVEEALFDDGRRNAAASFERARAGLGSLQATLASPDLVSLIPADERSFLSEGAARLARELAGVHLAGEEPGPGSSPPLFPPG